MRAAGRAARRRCAAATYADADRAAGRHRHAHRGGAARSTAPTSISPPAVLTVRAPSTASPARSPCTQHGQARCRLRPRARPSAARAERARRSSSPPAAPGWTATTSRTPSAVCCDAAGHHRRARRAPARLHDLRHTFAVTTLLDWYRDGRRRRRRSCRCCRPTSGTSIPNPPTGTCRPPPNCSRWPPPASTDRRAVTGVTRLAPMLQGFFTDRLIGQRQASPHTIAAYRDSFRLLLGFLAERTGKQPCDLDITTWTPRSDRRVPDPPGDRAGQRVSTRNARLAAIHSFFRYAALHAPEHAAADPTRAGDPRQTLRPGDRGLPHRTETAALLAARTAPTWPGRRDHALLSSPSRPGCGSPS